ncbi:hypothetical protein ACIBAC_15010 [Streptomyces sp. NPDC051362]|uniref:hypothetical protein n=1 Tax=Streptomyces sp. NPDC051362 TaxID=3365651 RepID=UPI0037A3B5CB
MNIRRTLANALLNVGILSGGAGAYLNHPDVTSAGIFLSVASIPLYARMYHQATDDQISSAELTGYMRALDHVKRGLLDQPPTDNGPGDRAEQDHTDNVIPLHALMPYGKHDGQKRKAQ